MYLVCNRASVPRRRVSPRAYRYAVITYKGCRMCERFVRELDSPAVSRLSRGKIERGAHGALHARAHVRVHRKLRRPTVHGNRLWGNVTCARVARVFIVFDFSTTVRAPSWILSLRSMFHFREIFAED